MNSWKIILAFWLALLVLVVTPLSVMAQGTESAQTLNRPKIKGTLAIVAPRLVLVGQEMQLTVFLRYNQTPLKDVAVWAVTREKATALQEKTQALRAKGIANITEDDYQTLLEPSAVQLGRTDEKGQLTNKFMENGNYLLVAVKAGYIPDWSSLAVRDALTIQAPQQAATGQTITVIVKQRGTGSPINEAGVWAVSRNTIAILKQEIQDFKTANNGNLENADWESLLDSQALRLGKTDIHGQVSYIFEDKGVYALVACKKGSISGFAVIRIVNPELNASPEVSKPGTLN